MVTFPGQASRQQRKQLERDNKSYPDYLVSVPKEQWPESILPSSKLPKESWRSKNFLVFVYNTKDGMERISVCRTAISGDRWKDGISWDDLQRLKSECGRGEKDAVEIYPCNCDVVNVANMRHLWILNEPLSFAWRKS